MPELPLVLAGPILRRVDARRVCVFLVLSQSADVTATIFSGAANSTGNGTADAPSVASQTRPTRTFGPKLHAVVVDVPAPGLPPRTRHSYDVVITPAGGQAQGLGALGMLDHQAGNPGRLALGYLSGRLPSFITPAREISQVRLAHASCRKSNGPGPDALAWLDARLAASVDDDITNVPQQLFLTGDQIYADDVAAVLLPMLNEVGRDMVGPEKLPIGNQRLDVTIDRFPALRRFGTVHTLGMLTSTECDNHLLTFGEYAAMYCAAFSPTVWRALPSTDSLFKQRPPDAATTGATDWEARYGTTDKWKTEKEGDQSRLDKANDELTRLTAWRGTVPIVARVLANIPTYMIFDDHEITDDWNISHRWRSRVHSDGFGTTILRNGLMAYTIFQAWGNDPTKFLHGEVEDVNGNIVGVPEENQRHPNDKSIEAIAELTASLPDPSNTQVALVDARLGLASGLSVPQAVFHYEVPGPRYTVRVLDTRTRRTYLGASHSPPRLLGDSLDAQLPAGPGGAGQQVLVVVSPVPVLFPRLIESAQPVLAKFLDFKSDLFRKEKAVAGEPVGVRGSERVDVEGWRADEVHHEQLLRRLSTYPRVVILSGDVHFASSLVLDYWGRGDDTQDSRMVQCTSSASRNQLGESERGLMRALPWAQFLLRGEPTERMGWDGAHGVALPFGTLVSPVRRAQMFRQPAILPTGGWPAGTTLSKAPDWQWRVEVVRDERPSNALPAGAPSIPFLPVIGPNPAASYAVIAGKHQLVARAPKDPVRLMVFRNNVGLVALAADGGGFSVTHSLLSSADDETGDAFTEHAVQFSPTPAPAPPALRTH